MNEENLLTDKEFGEYYGWSTRTIRDRLANGKSMPIYIKPSSANQRRWRMSDIKQWINDNSITD